MRSERTVETGQERTIAPHKVTSARRNAAVNGLFDHLIGAGIATDLHAGDGLLMFWTHSPIAAWQDDAWLAQMRKQLRPNAYLRLIENRFVGSESTFIDTAWWDACVDADLSPVIADRSLPVWIGVDASVKRDSTAIVAVTYKDGKVRLVAQKIFQPSPDAPLDFETKIEKRFATSRSASASELSDTTPTKCRPRRSG